MIDSEALIYNHKAFSKLILPFLINDINTSVLRRFLCPTVSRKKIKEVLLILK